MPNASPDPRSSEGCLLPREEDLRHRLHQLLSEHTVPGLAVAVVREGAVSWCCGLGIRDVGSSEPVTADTVFEAASLSKPVLAFAALQLVEQEHLDRPLDDYLPAPYLEGNEEPSTITARHVLCHTSGLPNWRKKNQPLRPQHAPSERFSYSGEGYVCLQKTVSAICEAPIGEVLSSHVFDPLEMQSSTFIWPSPELTDWAMPHDTKGATREKEAWDSVNCAAGLHCTASDYARLMAAALTMPIGSEMVSTQTLVNDQPSWHPAWPLGPCRENEAVGWGLGWGLGTVPDSRTIWHWGDNGGFRSFAIAWTATGEGIVILTNSDNGQDLIEELLRGLNRESWPELDWLNSIYGR